MIDVRQLHLSVGTFALKDVSLHVEPGEYFVLLGESGSGKTLLLECLCGLNRIHAGRIQLAGRDVTQLEPRWRGVGYVPQDYALFPHKTVRQNIRFGLDSGCVPQRPLWLEVDQLMERLGLAELADRFPPRLSGGEKQRVALARALAVGPRVLLLDEPVSALDERTRDALCRELKQIQQATGTTTVHVCHSFVEMLSVADRVAVMHDGRILQVGTPRETLERPHSTLVAQSVQPGNLFPARARVDGPCLRISCPGTLELLASKPEAPVLESDVMVMIREENIHLGKRAQSAFSPQIAGQRDTVSERNSRLSPFSVLEGTVHHLADVGPTVRVTVACGTELLLSVSLGRREFSAAKLAVGQHVSVTIGADEVHVMPR